MTVSKTTTRKMTTWEKAQQFAHGRCLGVGMWTIEEATDFGDWLTAELQKDNAEIAKALGIHFCPELEEPWEVPMESEPDYFETLPKAAAFVYALLDKGLSDREKENARLREALTTLSNQADSAIDRHIAAAALSKEKAK